MIAIARPWETLLAPKIEISVIHFLGWAELLPHGSDAIDTLTEDGQADGRVRVQNLGCSR
jgi:hypothetical protein